MKDAELFGMAVFSVEKFRRMRYIVGMKNLETIPKNGGPMMACIMLTVLPIIVIYLICQKHIIKGAVAGAVKG